MPDQQVAEPAKQRQSGPDDMQNHDGENADDRFPDIFARHGSDGQCREKNDGDQVMRGQLGHRRFPHQANDGDGDGKQQNDFSDVQQHFRVVLSFARCDCLSLQV